MQGSELFNLLICLSPLVYGLVCYLLGRYGLPFELRRRKLRDRRKPGKDPNVGEIAPDDDSDQVLTYRA